MLDLVLWWSKPVEWGWKCGLEPQWIEGALEAWWAQHLLVSENDINRHTF